MSTNTRRLGLSVARVGAVTLALGVGGYLVVTAQRRANPDRTQHVPTSESTPPVAVDAPATAGDVLAEPVVTTTAESGAPATPTSADYLPSSKVLVIQPPTPSAPETPAYLMGSKSGVMAPVANDGQVGETGTKTAPVPATPPVFLPTSKSGAPIVDVAPEPLPFLPSSKSKAIGGELRPVLRPAPVPPAPQESKPAPTTTPKPESTPPKTDTPKPHGSSTIDRTR